MKSMMRNTIKFLLAVALSFAVIEVFITYAGIASPSKYEFGDERLFQKLKPNNFFLSQNEGFFIGKTNDYGYLGPSYKPWKDRNTFRIVLLGDSYVEGIQLYDEYSLRSIIESHLSKISDKKIEVLNFGRSGFDLHQMYAYYELFAKDFQPDLTLFFVANYSLNPGVSEGYIEVAPKGDSVAFVKHFPDYRNSFKWKLKNNVLDRLSLYNLLRGAVEIAATDQVPRILFDKLYFPKNEKAQSRYLKSGQDTEELNAVTVGVLKALARQMDEDKKFALVYYKDNFSKRYVDLADSLKIPSINLAPVLLELTDKGIDPEYWPVTRSRGHWNHYGHKVVGEALSKEIPRIIGDKLYARPEFRYTTSANK